TVAAGASIVRSAETWIVPIRPLYQLRVGTDVQAASRGGRSIVPAIGHCRSVAARCGLSPPGPTAVVRRTSLLIVAHASSPPAAAAAAQIVIAAWNPSVSLAGLR